MLLHNIQHWNNSPLKSREEESGLLFQWSESIAKALMTVCNTIRFCNVALTQPQLSILYQPKHPSTLHKSCTMEMSYWSTASVHYCA